MIGSVYRFGGGVRDGGKGGKVLLGGKGAMAIAQIAPVAGDRFGGPTDRLLLLGLRAG